MASRKDYEETIEREVGKWPGVTVRFEEGGKHPRAVLTFEDREGTVPYPGTPSDSRFGIHRKLGDLRRKLREIGAEREEPATVADGPRDYRKPNPGAALRQLPMGEAAVLTPSIVEQLAALGLIPEARAFAALESEDEGDAADALQAAVDGIVDGIYFGLPKDVYHAVRRLSTSALQEIDCSPADWWKDSWLDPNPTVLTEEQEKKRSMARVIGSAYHVARLEPDLFESSYVRELDKREMPRGTLSSDAAVKAQLKAKGLTQAIGTETLLERAQRLVEGGYEGTILSIEEARWEEEVNGRISLPAITYDEILIDMERIHGSGAVAEKLEGGAAEVSIFWTDEHGLKMKARVDYLTAKHWVDFKTFANPRRKRLAQVLAEAFRYERYHMQAVVYRDAIEHVRTGGLQIIGEATDAQRGMIAAIQIAPAELKCFYVFQQKGGVPNLLSRRVHFYDIDAYRDAETSIMAKDDEHFEDSIAKQMRPTQLFRRGRVDVENAKAQFNLYAQVYAPGEPWRPIEPEGSFDDSDFNTHWLEGIF
jgi:hypothetical protein